MNLDHNKLVDGFFKKLNVEKLLYEAFAERITSRYPNVSIEVQKSQIKFLGNMPFCWVWLPIRKGISDRPPDYIIISFALNHRVINPRIVEAANPYPNRWTHHVIVCKSEEVDAELMEWIEQAYTWKNSN